MRLSQIDKDAFLVSCEKKELPLQLLTPEASPRRYFRPSPAGDWLYVESPSPAPVAITEWLSSLEVPLPAIGAVRERSYLVEDLGDRMLSHEPTLHHYHQLITYWKAFAFQTLPTHLPNASLALDKDLFLKELQLFHSGYLETRQTIDSSLLPQLKSLYSRLAIEASDGPQLLQHRDFHCRNIMLAQNRGLTIIDHQDLRVGPFSYDMASLLTDAYVDLPKDVCSFLRGEVHALGQHLGMNSNELQRQYLCTALQRVLKALGTFGCLLSQGRSEYSSAETRALAHAKALLKEMPDYQAIAEVLPQ